MEQWHQAAWSGAWAGRTAAGNMAQTLHSGRKQTPYTAAPPINQAATQHHSTCQPPPTVSLQLSHDRLAGSRPHRDAAHRHAGPIVAHGAARAVGLHTNLVNLCSRERRTVGWWDGWGRQDTGQATHIHSSCCMPCPTQTARGTHQGSPCHVLHQLSPARPCPAVAAHRCHRAFGTWPR